jgi:hypothetical protein
MPGWPIESLLFIPAPVGALVPAGLFVPGPVGLLVVAPFVGMERGAALPAPVVVEVDGLTPTPVEPEAAGPDVPVLAEPPPLEPPPELPPPDCACAWMPRRAAPASSAAVVTKRAIMVVSFVLGLPPRRDNAMCGRPVASHCEERKPASNPTRGPLLCSTMDSYVPPERPEPADRSGLFVAMRWWMWGATLLFMASALSGVASARRTPRPYRPDHRTGEK